MAIEPGTITPYAKYSQFEQLSTYTLRPPTPTEKRAIAAKFAGQSWIEALTPGNIVAKAQHTAVLIEQCDRAIQVGNTQGAGALVAVIEKTSEEKASLLRARMTGLVEWPIQKFSAELIPVGGVLFQAEESTLHFAMEARLGRSSIPLADWHPSDQD